MYARYVHCTGDLQVRVVETALLAGIRIGHKQGGSVCHHVWSEAPATDAADADSSGTEQQQQRQQQRRLVLTGLPMAAIKTVLQQVLLNMARNSTSSSSSSSDGDSSANVSAVQQPLQLVGTSMVRLRALLRNAGLSTNGTRGELLERLQTAATATTAGDATALSEDASSDSTTADTGVGYSGAHVISEHVHSAQHDLVITGVQGVGALVRAYLTKQLLPPLVFHESTKITFDIDGDAVVDSASNSTAATAREGTMILTSAQLQQWQQSYFDSQLAAAAATDGVKAKKRASYEMPRYS
jgi:hypothetical protein